MIYNRKAFSSLDEEKWQETVGEEMQAMQEYEMRIDVPLPKGKSVIGRK